MSEARPIRRLYRSRTEKVVAGVCGGLAEYFAMEPVMLRILWACLTIFLAVVGGMILYLVCWIAIPKQPKKPAV